MARGPGNVTVVDGDAPRERFYKTVYWAFLDEIVRALTPISGEKKIYIGNDWPSGERIIRKSSFFGREDIASVNYCWNSRKVDITVNEEASFRYIQAVAERNKDKFNGIEIEQNF